MNEFSMGAALVRGPEGSTRPMRVIWHMQADWLRRYRWVSVPDADRHQDPVSMVGAGGPLR